MLFMILFPICTTPPRLCFYFIYDLHNTAMVAFFSCFYCIYDFHNTTTVVLFHDFIHSSYTTPVAGTTWWKGEHNTTMVVFFHEFFCIYDSHNTLFIPYLYINQFYSWFPQQALRGGGPPLHGVRRRLLPRAPGVPRRVPLPPALHPHGHALG